MSNAAILAIILDDVPPADFRFELETVPQGRVVKTIIFERGGDTVQKLDVPSMTPLAQDESFFFGAQEINFDGWLDLLLMTERDPTMRRLNTGCMTLRLIAFATLASFRCFAWMRSTSS